MKQRSATITAERLREILSYSEETGVFTRLQRTSTRIHVGDVAGSLDANGYIIIYADNRPYKAHRLAWLHVHGVWPDNQIDHIDGCRSNNALANLRDVTRSVNAQNKRCAPSHSTHGFMGVTRNKKRWQAKIRLNGVLHHIGLYETPEQAHAAYIATKRQLHEGCTI
jgi:hypothetical protein